jgi:hypothetical protein
VLHPSGGEFAEWRVLFVAEEHRGVVAEVTVESAARLRAEAHQL